MIGEIEYNGVTLDWMAQEVLFTVEAASGESDTTEVRKSTGYHSERIKYRFEKLEKADLLRVGSPVQLESGRMSATPVETTNEGKKVVHQGFADPDDEQGSLIERLQVIERRAERYEDLREAYHETKEEVEKLQDRVQLLERRIEGIE